MRCQHPAMRCVWLLPFAGVWMAGIAFGSCASAAEADAWLGAGWAQYEEHANGLGVHGRGAQWAWMAGASLGGAVGARGWLEGALRALGWFGAANERWQRPDVLQTNRLRLAERALHLRAGIAGDGLYGGVWMGWLAHAQTRSAFRLGGAPVAHPPVGERVRARWWGVWAADAKKRWGVEIGWLVGAKARNDLLGDFFSHAGEEVRGWLASESGARCAALWRRIQGGRNPWALWPENRFWAVGCGWMMRW